MTSMMKNLFLSVLCLFCIHDLLMSKDLCDGISQEKWLLMSGYGYSHTLSEINVNGVGSVTSLIYIPRKTIGIGIDYGLNHTEGTSRKWDSTNSYVDYYDIFSDWFVGPDLYWFPINNNYHRFHVGIGGNIFKSHQTGVHNRGDSYDDYKTNVSYGKETSICNFGLNASIGYSIKIMKHFELGIRGYTSFFQEGFNLNALLNLSVSF